MSRKTGKRRRDTENFLLLCLTIINLIDVTRCLSQKKKERKEKKEKNSANIPGLRLWKSQGGGDELRARNMRRRPSPSFVLSFFLLQLSFLLFSTLKLLFYYTQAEEKSPRKQAQGVWLLVYTPQTVQSVCVCVLVCVLYLRRHIDLDLISLTWSARERKREIDTNAPVSPAVLYGRSPMGGNYRSRARKGNRWALILC